MLVGLNVAGSVEAWRRIGVVADGADCAQVGQVLLSTGAESMSWTLLGEPSTANTIDGLATRWRADAPPIGRHPVYSRVDHVVVFTDDLLRTSEAIESATAQPLKRVRDVPGTKRQQGFHRFGEVIVEIVAPIAGPTSFWGLVLVAHDLDAVCAELGHDLVSPPKTAVQPGRRIAGVRDAVGLGCPIALMD